MALTAPYAGIGVPGDNQLDTVSQLNRLENILKTGASDKTAGHVNDGAGVYKSIFS
jgi:hypothetical protein